MIAINGCGPTALSMVVAGLTGDFTSTGHFIVFAGIKDGKIQVNDPNSKKRTKLWDYDKLKDQINNLWVFTQG